MSSTKSNSTETGAGEKSRGISRGAVGMVALTTALLGALVWGLTPSRPHLTPAPLRPVPPGCLKERNDFVPTNLTEVPNLPLDGLEIGRATSELQSQSNLVCRLLLEKKKKEKHSTQNAFTEYRTHINDDDN